MQFGVISPQDWGFPPATALPDRPITELGVSLLELEARAKNATYDWLLKQYNEETAAFHGFYRAHDKYREFCQTVNLIAPWQLLAAYDRYHDPHLLDLAQRAATWFYERHVVTHPMSVVAGGVRDGEATDEVWTKFTAEEVITCLALFQRTNLRPWLERAAQSGRFLIQARRHHFAPRYSLSSGKWMGRGWDSWGRVVEALWLLWRACGEDHWRDEALLWGEHALDIQATDGAFYLIDGEYYNTDLAADELRALTLLHEWTGRADFLQAACRFADWHVVRQTDRGAWALTVDCDGNEVMPIVGPGDVPNIGISLLHLYHATRDSRYLDSVYKAARYSLSIQATPDSGHPYLDDDLVRWGFWSWDPYYDYTLSGDQSTHHVRGLWFLVDYLCTSLENK